MRRTQVCLHEGIVSASSSSRAHAHQAYMVASLNTLPWVRVDVDVLHRQAHSAVVMLDAGLPGLRRHWDHLEYLASRVMGLGAAGAAAEGKGA